MNKTIRVKVKTEALLAAVKARRVTMVTKHERATAGYSKRVNAYQGKVVDALRKALADAEKGKFPDTGYNSLNIRWRGGSAPSESELDTLGIDRLIATLEMAADESMTITSEDAARYLG